MINLARTRIVVTAWPDHRWPVEIIWWIEELMRGVKTRPGYRDSLNRRDIICARNAAIDESALGSSMDFEWFIFIDRDVRPDSRTRKFLDLESDVKCCEVEQNSKNAYAWPDSFHDAIWCTSREVLKAIEPPWFMRKYNAKGTNMVGCLCNSFREKVLEAGFSIAHGGWANHDRDGSWCG